MLQSSDIKFHIAGRLTVVHVNDYQIDEENHKAPKCKRPSKKSSLPVFIIRPLYFFPFSFFFSKTDGWLGLCSVWSACRQAWWRSNYTRLLVSGPGSFPPGCAPQSTPCGAGASVACRVQRGSLNTHFYWTGLVLSEEEILGLYYVWTYRYLF